MVHGKIWVSPEVTSLDHGSTFAFLYPIVYVKPKTVFLNVFFKGQSRLEEG